MRYLNVKYKTVETVDELNPDDFKTRKEFRKELWRLKEEYHRAGIPVYISRRCTNDWKNR